MVKSNSQRYYRDEQLLAFIGAKMKEIRLSKDISIGVLAKECKVDDSQISRMEHGKVNFSMSMLYRIAEVLKVAPRDLLPPL
ncbi:helix-turn-helix transcriptional regulator [Ilyomonas limi]|uniref:Helix-turn-helix transcriptional regulator n=1 Tax=Ilyomonas limi TaxID=2575867 RepID=A0A4U3KV55_9BACT|nr:helix-turn-helix transcriptional regulator [Ilyomonas limi]